MTDSTPIVPFGGLHGSGNDKTQFELIVELERDLAAAQEENTKFREELQIAVDRLTRASGDLAVYANEAKKVLP